MCNYCETYLKDGEEVVDPLPSCDEGEYGAQFVIFDGMLIATMYPPATANIRYCPMCKRELGSDSDDVGCGDELRDAITTVIDDYRKTLVKIGCMLGFDDGELPVMPEILIDELDKRLMPPGFEWPKFNDGEKVNVDDYIMHDGKSERVQGIYLNNSMITLSLVGVDHEQLPTVEYGERIMRPETEALGADGLPTERASEYDADRDLIMSEIENTKLINEIRSIAKEVGIPTAKKDIHTTIEEINAELQKRLMPPGMEWPRFEDGVMVVSGAKVVER